jgi:dTMP kinase
MGRFIVFEGGEGCGKTTQLNMLSKVLRAQGINVTCTREPGGTPFAEDLRSLFKRVSHHGDSPTALCELHLVLSARAQHLEKVVLPFVCNGDSNSVMLCDRFLDSTYVYQGIMRGLGKNAVDDAARGIVKSFLPCLTLVLNCPAKVSWNRTQARRSLSEENKSLVQDRLDDSEFTDFVTLATGFERVCKEEWTYPNSRLPKRELIDAQQSPEEMHAAILERVLKVIRND